MYDPTHHIHMFRSAPAYLFRGARLNGDYENPYRGSGVTPTSIDPLVATLFAAHERTKGQGFVLILDKSHFCEKLGGASSRTHASLELAVNLGMLPMEVEKSAAKIIPVDRSLEILQRLGHTVTQAIHTPTQLQHELEATGRLYPEEIEKYASLALGG